MKGRVSDQLWRSRTSIPMGWCATDFTKPSLFTIMRVTYKHVRSEAAWPGLAPAHPTSSSTMLLWLPGTWATVSQETQCQWVRSRRQSAAFNRMSSPLLVKGRLWKESFEMRIQVDREGQEPRHTCSNDRQVVSSVCCVMFGWGLLGSDQPWELGGGVWCREWCVLVSLGWGDTL